MKKTLTLINLLLVLILVTVAPKAAQAESYILKAAQTIEVGTVEVSNTSSELTVTYNITALNWGIAETHLDVATDPNDIPQTKKQNPILGKFDPNTCSDHDPAVTTYTYIIPGSFSPGQSLFIAAHAALVKETVIDGTTIIEEETAWADGIDFQGKNWATYIEYELPMPDLVVSGITLGAIANGDLNYSYTIANTGGEGPAGVGPTFDVVAYISTDDILDEGDAVLTNSYSVWTYHLSEGWSQSRTESDTSLPDISPGDYYLIVVADVWPGLPPNYYPGVEESNENNNWTAAMFTAPELLPDLVVSDTTIDISGNGLVNYTYAITNIGAEGPAGNSTFDVATYFSTDDIFDDGDTRVAGSYGVWTYHLSEGWSQSQTKSTTVALPPGDYYLITVADVSPNLPPNYWPGVDEADEENNWTATMYTIPEAYPDLVVSDITLNSITNTVVDYTYTIANIGDEGPIGYGPAFAV
ncbi:MAG: hypothetical protein ACYS6K_27335, partial [Planctomycetota bacterium]